MQHVCPPCPNFRPNISIAIHKALQALNRLESAVNDPRYNPMVEDELDEICVDSRPGTADSRPGTGDRDSRAGLAVPASEDQSSRDGLIDPDTPGTSDSEGNWRERHNTVTGNEGCHGYVTGPMSPGLPRPYITLVVTSH